MIPFFRRHWFFTLLIAVVATGLAFPDLGPFLKHWHVIDILIILNFLVTGLTLETHGILREFRNLKAFLASVASSLVLFPLLTFGLVKAFGIDDPDAIIGVYILAVVPATIATGTVLTAVARGNVPMTLMICLATNFLAVLTIPPLLRVLLTLDVTIDLPVLELMRTLALMMILPVLIGQVLRIPFRTAVEPRRAMFSVFSQGVILIVILSATAASATRIRDLGMQLLILALFALVLHVLALAGNYGLARLLRFDRPSTTAFTLHVSQKTLGLAYVVWSTCFASFGLGLLPTVLYHLVQSVMDAVLAHRIGRAATRPARWRLNPTRTPFPATRTRTM